MDTMEKSKDRTETIAIAAILAVLAIIILAAVFLSGRPRTLYPGEVRDYQGENLSSISDIVDNAIIGTQVLNQTTYHLTVNGLVNTVKTYSYDQVKNDVQNYQKVVTLYCVEGWNAKVLWQGVLVRDLLNASGASPTATVVIFHATDGYTTALPVSYFYDHDILFAYKMNDVVIPQEKGFPFQLVAESKFGYKWIKWIDQIQLSDNTNYLGYWESRGYNNNATAPGP
jgi:DMSO/TMAO reductase YedYZ molybdopterin-dependent catalytic subunit